MTPSSSSPLPGVSPYLHGLPSTLAIDGGPRAVPAGNRIAAWPQVLEEDRALVLAALDSGRYTTASAGEIHINALEQEWAQTIGVGYCVAVNNGTTGLMLALAAAGVGPGDDVLVPSLSFIATAYAVVHLGAHPVFVEVDQSSYNVTLASLNRARTHRTKAVVLVHLHGLPVDLDVIGRWAEERNILVIEDAAQAHGATFGGKPVGSFGAINSFSLNVSKNLPTCGEGGLVTTDDPSLYQRALMMRQFGEIIPRRGHRSYVSHMMGWNLKPSALNCAFTRAQLRRFPEVDIARRSNVERFLTQLAELPGLIPPTQPRGRTHAWHILRFGVDPIAFGLPPSDVGPLRKTIMEVLRAEGVPASHYQVMPLPAQPPLSAISSGDNSANPADTAANFPNAHHVIDSTFTIQKAHLSPDAAPLLSHYVSAFHKVWSDPERIRKRVLASRADYKTPWAEATLTAQSECRSV